MQADPVVEAVGDVLDDPLLPRRTVPMLNSLSQKDLCLLSSDIRTLLSRVALTPEVYPYTST